MLRLIVKVQKEFWMHSIQTEEEIPSNTEFFQKQPK